MMSLDIWRICSDVDEILHTYLYDIDLSKKTIYISVVIWLLGRITEIADIGSRMLLYCPNQYEDFVIIVIFELF